MQIVARKFIKVVGVDLAPVIGTILPIGVVEGVGVVVIEVVDKKGIGTEPQD